MATRKYKPTSPARRQMSVAGFTEITKGKPERSLVRKLKRTGGRNNLGRITALRPGWTRSPTRSPWAPRM